jgi:Ni/Co efflux regulator RcnB
MGGPRPGGPGGAQFSFHGRALSGMHAEPYAYPPGFGYRRWDVGAALPPFFLVPAYFFADWATLGLEPPPPGTQWVRYGPDLLLVDVSNGQVIDVAYGVFY